MNSIGFHQGIGLIMLAATVLMGCDRHLPLLSLDIPRPPPELAIAAAPHGPSADAATGVRRRDVPLFTHVVRWSGETLVTMARWYTGQDGNWRSIAKVNPGLDPTRINIGDKIRIPSELLKTHRPLPKTAVSARARKIRETKPAEGQKTATDPVGTALYGPIEDIPQISPSPAHEDSTLPPLETID